MVAKVRPGLVLSVPPTDAERALVTLVPHTTSLRGSRFEVEAKVAFLKPGAFDAQGLVTIPFEHLDDADRELAARADRRRRGQATQLQDVEQRGDLGRATARDRVEARLVAPRVAPGGFGDVEDDTEGRALELVTHDPGERRYQRRAQGVQFERDAVDAQLAGVELHGIEHFVGRQQRAHAIGRRWIGRNGAGGRGRRHLGLRDGGRRRRTTANDHRRRHQGCSMPHSSAMRSAQFLPRRHSSTSARRRFCA
jgi:hypothetical protein